MIATNSSVTEYPFEVLKGAIENSKYLTEIKFIKLKDASIQQVSDNVYIARGYKSGQNYPDPHEWACTVVVESGLYHCFGFTRVDGGEMKLSHMKAAHAYFKKMGLKPEYIRGKHIK
jgi:hypothetical protein